MRSKTWYGSKRRSALGQRRSETSCSSYWCRSQFWDGSYMTHHSLYGLGKSLWLAHRLLCRKLYAWASPVQCVHEHQNKGKTFCCVLEKCFRKCYSSIGSYKNVSIIRIGKLWRDKISFDTLAALHTLRVGVERLLTGVPCFRYRTINPEKYPQHVLLVIKLKNSNVSKISCSKNLVEWKCVKRAQHSAYKEESCFREHLYAGGKRQSKWQLIQLTTIRKHEQERYETGALHVAGN